MAGDLSTGLVLKWPATSNPLVAGVERTPAVKGAPTVGAGYTAFDGMDDGLDLGYEAALNTPSSELTVILGWTPLDSTAAASAQVFLKKQAYNATWEVRLDNLPGGQVSFGALVRIDTTNYMTQYAESSGGSSKIWLVLRMRADGATPLAASVYSADGVLLSSAVTAAPLPVGVLNHGATPINLANSFFDDQQYHAGRFHGAAMFARRLADEDVGAFMADPDAFFDPPAPPPTTRLPLPLLAGDDDMRDLFYSPDGSADRLTLEFEAWKSDGTPATGITGVTPALRVNGGAASATHAVGAATSVRAGRYRVAVKRASVAPGNDVLVESFTGADYVLGGVGRVVAVDVASVAATEAEVADAVAAHADIQAIKTDAAAAKGSAASADGKLSSTLLSRLDRVIKKVTNRKTLAGGVLTVFEEDGTTPAFTEAITGTSTVTGSTPL